MSLQVYRTGASTYQNSTFLENEKIKLETLPGVKYIKQKQEIAGDIPLALITNTHTIAAEIPSVLLEQTKIMIHPNSGYDNFTASFIKSCHFPIIKGNGIRAHAVSEYVLACIFKELTPIMHHDQWSKDRNWNRKLLRDQKVLLLGHGHIGKLINGCLSPLVNDIKVYDPDPNSIQQVNNVQTQWTEDLFKNVDILILATDLNHTSREIINKNVLSQVSKSCLIINPARGQLIVEKDLEQFLKSNQSAKAYIDVFNTEPFQPGHLENLKNLNKTSHIAGVFEKLNQDIIEFEYKVLKSFLSHQDTDQYLLQFKTLYSQKMINAEFLAMDGK